MSTLTLTTWHVILINNIFFNFINHEENHENTWLNINIDDLAFCGIEEQNKKN